MKKHNFKQAIEIFKGMFEGWSVVTTNGYKHPLEGFDFNIKGKERVLANCGHYFQDIISHLEQTLPMNGDDVWAWAFGADDEEKNKCIYIGKDKVGLHICQTDTMTIRIYEKVELVSPARKIPISEATELLMGVVNEPFEIVK